MTNASSASGSTNPESVADVLRAVAGHLDESDQTIAILARKAGDEFDPAGEVQQDLRRLANHLEEQPDIDAQLFDAVPNLRNWNVPVDYLQRTGRTVWCVQRNTRHPESEIADQDLIEQGTAAEADGCTGEHFDHRPSRDWYDAMGYEYLENQTD